MNKIGFVKFIDINVDSIAFPPSEELNIFFGDAVQRGGDRSPFADRMP